jgi:hypothetical protein
VQPEILLRLCQPACQQAGVHRLLQIEGLDAPMEAIPAVIVGRIGCSFLWLGLDRSGDVTLPAECLADCGGELIRASRNLRRTEGGPVSELVRLRMRAGTRPRPVQEPPQHPTRPSRRDILVHVHADENERAASAAVVETLDRVPVLIIVGVADGAALVNAEATSTRWSKRKRSLPARPSDWTPDSGSSTRTRRVASRSPSTSWNRYSPRSTPSCST